MNRRSFVQSLGAASLVGVDAVVLGKGLEEADNENPSEFLVNAWLGSAIMYELDPLIVACIDRNAGDNGMDFMGRLTAKGRDLSWCEQSIEESGFTALVGFGDNTPTTCRKKFLGGMGDFRGAFVDWIKLLRRTSFQLFNDISFGQDCIRWR